ncbi:hypothetical protein DSL72_008854 [Monilinia vaccinii-corymbosi]|uniref:Ketoreductase domain-containing protein n=1 Tax=Monilinia vaccinii-corymbosi TaxID=61207 RepID=A0A8A3PSB7_9HELO|nr:hypothetical protein DSL72_008854 [Monilinia vaccinii-corymbosi]
MSSPIEGREKLPALAVIDWTTRSEVSIKVGPVNFQASFSGNRTYWLVGLTGGLVLPPIHRSDVTHKKEVVTLYAEISLNMPAIAGVAQSVITLQDTDIQEMTIERFLKEKTLEFVIFFSSASSMIGNHGRANYAAANTFMASLAEQRKRRGLAASAIDIGPVFGVGSVTQHAERSVFSHLTLHAGGFVRA